MKKLLLMLFCCILSVAAWSQQSRPPRVVSINGTYTSTRTLQPFLGSHNLHALAISGSVTLNSDTSLVRVIMHDVDGKSYLMYEASPMLINGYTDTLTNANEETEWMCGVVPQDLKIVVKDATCTVTGLTATQYSADNHPLRAPAQRDSIRIRQVQAKVDKINAYLGSHDKYWVAGITSKALSCYNQKCGSETYNIDVWDYYIDGILEVGEAFTDSVQLTINNTSFTESFDWRHYNGKNWITKPKDQSPNNYETNYCWAFSAVGIVEAMANLYYNREINLDLSEEDLAMHCGARNANGSLNSSMRNKVHEYIETYGVCMEDDFPIHTTDDFEYMERRDSIACFKSFGYTPFTTASNSGDFEIDLKHALINRGPMDAVCWNVVNHDMMLVGYKMLQVGDTVSSINGLRDRRVLREGNDLIGRLCWIFKDNYAYEKPWLNQGFKYIVFNKYSPHLKILGSYDMPITVNNTQWLPDSIWMKWNMIIEDNDGDGYYTWGFKQPKPASLPDWVPDEQDGDDSDYTKCTMDEYGFLQDLVYSPNDTIFIDSDQTFCGLKHLYRPIKVQNHATLTIASNIQGHGDASIVLVEGSHLDISNGTLENISIIGNGASVINIHENSRLNISRSDNNSVSLRRTQ